VLCDARHVGGGIECFGWLLLAHGGVLVPVLVLAVTEESVPGIWEGELSQAAGEQMKSGGAMVTAVNSARGVFTEIAVGRCFVIRCDARDYGMERNEKMPGLHASTRAT
jgi:hypothetical protein